MNDDSFLRKDGETLKEMRLLLLELQKTQLFIVENQKFYDNADLRSLLNVSDRTLYRLRKMNKIPFFKLGNKYYYPKEFFNKQALN